MAGGDPQRGVTRAFLVGVGLVVAVTAYGAGPSCEEGRSVTGLAVGVVEGSLTVVGIDAASPAARAGFRDGDQVLQVNDVVPATCSQWGRAVAAARDAGKALLVLVRRDGAEVPLVVGAAAWTPPGAPQVAGGTTPPPSGGTTTRPRVAAPPPPPPPLADDVQVSVGGVLDGLARLTPPEDEPGDRAAYGAAVLQVRRQIETLAARHAAPEATVRALRGAARYYEAAGVAWDASEQRSDVDRRSRRLPVPDGMTVEYFSDSPAAQILDEFPFLDAAVARPPSSMSLGVESAGRWRPVWARVLLWERGAHEVERLRGTLGA